MDFSKIRELLTGIPKFEEWRSLLLELNRWDDLRKEVGFDVALTYILEHSGHLPVRYKTFAIMPVIDHLWKEVDGYDSEHYAYKNQKRGKRILELAKYIQIEFADGQFCNSQNLDLTVFENVRDCFIEVCYPEDAEPDFLEELIVYLAKSGKVSGLVFYERFLDFQDESLQEIFGTIRHLELEKRSIDLLEPLLSRGISFENIVSLSFQKEGDVEQVVVNKFIDEHMPMLKYIPKNYLEIKSKNDEVPAGFHPEHISLNASAIVDSEMMNFVSELEGRGVFSRARSIFLVESEEFFGYGDDYGSPNAVANLLKLLVSCGDASLETLSAPAEIIENFGWIIERCCPNVKIIPDEFMIDHFRDHH